MGHISDAERNALLQAVDHTRVDLPDGTYVARTSVVAARLARQSSRSMIKEIAETWPELFRDGSWSKATLRTYPAYVLAVILCQDDDAPSCAGQRRIINSRILGDFTPLSKG